VEWLLSGVWSIVNVNLQSSYTCDEDSNKQKQPIVLYLVMSPDGMVCEERTRKLNSFSLTYHNCGYNWYNNLLGASLQSLMGKHTTDCCLFHHYLLVLFLVRGTEERLLISTSGVLSARQSLVL